MCEAGADREHRFDAPARVSRTLTGAVAALADPGAARSALAQAWPPFALIAGLVLVGVVADRDGVFTAAAARVARLGGSPATLLTGLLGLVAFVTAVLNLDTAVVFLTPLMIHVARECELDERPFLYGSVLMVNAASLTLPGANLTNLLVLSEDHVSGGVFFSRMLPASLAAIVVTAGGLLLLFRHALRGSTAAAAGERAALTGRLGVAGVALAAVLVLLLPAPALPVLGLGLALALARAAQRHVSPRESVRAVNPGLLLGLLGITVALGTVARAWSEIGAQLAHLGAVPTAAVAAVAAVGLNNLPATMLLASTPPVHPRALLIGLNLGPNLAVTGSLSALLWLQVARGAGCRPSVLTYSRLGIVLAPLAIGASLLALVLISPSS